MYNWVYFFEIDVLFEITFFEIRYYFLMDFNKLKALLPKLPEQWDREDITLWLQFIGCEKYVEHFSTFLIRIE